MKKKDVKIMKVELLVTTITFLMKFGLLFVIIMFAIVNYGEVGIILAAFLIVSVKISSPRIVYRHEILDE